MKKRSIVIILLIVALLIGGYFTIYFDKPIEVEQVTSEQRRVIESINISGIVETDKSATLSFNTSGKINKINYLERSNILKGEVIATIDKNKFFNDAKAARDARDIQSRELDLFIEQWKDDIDYQQSDEYSLRIRQLRERVSQAQANYNSLLSTSKNYELVSPISGVIRSVNKLEGEFVSPGEPIIEIINNDSIHFKVSANQEDLGSIYTQQKARVKLDAYKDTIFEGIVSELPLTSTVTQTDSLFDIKIDLYPNEQNVVVGMIGDADLILQDSEIEVPTLFFDQIFTDDEGDFVWISKNEVADKLYIDVGVEGDLYVQVSDSVFKENKVVTPVDSNQELNIGDKIKIIQDE